MKLVTCEAMHPGSHVKTGTCKNPKPISRGARFANWLERKLNPKQGDPNSYKQCSCGNAFLENGQGVCMYCGKKQ